MHEGQGQAAQYHASVFNFARTWEQFDLISILTARRGRAASAGADDFIAVLSNRGHLVPPRMTG
jgi:hypothetical protein